MSPARTALADSFAVLAVINAGGRLAGPERLTSSARSPLLKLFLWNSATSVQQVAARRPSTVQAGNVSWPLVCGLCAAASFASLRGRLATAAASSGIG